MQHSILIGIPTMGSIHPLLALRLIKWAKEYPVEFHFTYKVAPVDRARNQIVKAFLDGSYSHLLFVDSDTVPPPDAIERLLSHDKPVVSGLTPIFNMEDMAQHDNCYVGKKSVARHTGLQQIDRCGASCLLIKREVFDLLPEPYFQTIMNPSGTDIVRSEDLGFCEEVKGAEYVLFADTDVVCEHYKEMQLV